MVAHVFPVVYFFDIISLFASVLEEPKIGISGKRLRHRIIDKRSVKTYFKSNNLNVSELARDYLQRCDKYNVIAGIMSPVSDGYNKKVRDLLTLSQTTNFRLFQTERVCRPQFQIG